MATVMAAEEAGQIKSMWDFSLESLWDFMVWDIGPNDLLWQHQKDS